MFYINNILSIGFVLYCFSFGRERNIEDRAVHSEITKAITSLSLLYIPNERESQVTALQQWTNNISLNYLCLSFITKIHSVNPRHQGRSFAKQVVGAEPAKTTQYCENPSISYFSSDLTHFLAQVVGAQAHTTEYEITPLPATAPTVTQMFTFSAVDSVWWHGALKHWWYSILHHH